MLKSQIRKFATLIRKPKIRKFPQKTAQVCLKTILYMLHIFVKTKNMYLRTCGSFKIANHTKDWVRKSQIHICHIWGRSANITNLRICDMRNFFADRPPWKTTTIFASASTSCKRAFSQCEGFPRRNKSSESGLLRCKCSYTLHNHRKWRAKKVLYDLGDSPPLPNPPLSHPTLPLIFRRK